MNIAIRESMAPGATLEERLAWLESADIEGIELHAESMDLPFDELRDIFSRSSRRVSAVQGMSTLLDRYRTGLRPDRPLIVNDARSVPPNEVTSLTHPQ